MSDCVKRGLGLGSQSDGLLGSCRERCAVGRVDKASDQTGQLQVPHMTSILFGDILWYPI